MWKRQNEQFHVGLVRRTRDIFPPDMRSRSFGFSPSLSSRRCRCRSRCLKFLFTTQKQLCFIPNRVRRLAARLRRSRHGNLRGLVGILYVSPFLESLETMKAFHSNLGIDIFKRRCFTAWRFYTIHSAWHFKKTRPPRALRTKR